ncbi:MAG: putative RND superfamily exporter protein [Planctomycetota bacterium]|jgi:predicted RND superfamily exporter protein
MSSNSSNPSRLDFAEWVFRLRWPLSLVLLVALFLVGSGGAGTVNELTNGLSRLGDTAGGLPPQPLMFDPRTEIWFGLEDPSVAAYNDLEDKFVAEDYVVVAFEEKEDSLGVFSRRSLTTIARLTEELLQVPGVRHVRSLTSAPWIRYGQIDGSGEDGLIVSDLVHMPESEISNLSDEQLVERMVAVLGGQRSAELVGAELVRRAIGDDANLDDFIGEPLMLGTIVDEAASITTIQVQVLRGRISESDLEAAFAEDSVLRGAAPALFSVQKQQESLRGIRHVLRVERGLAIPTPGYAKLQTWIDGLPSGLEKDRLTFEFSDPNRNFMLNSEGALVRKYFEYESDGEGGYFDRSDANNVVTAQAGFVPKPSSPYEFRLAGSPLFEGNFVEVGTADMKYMGFVMALIILVLLVIFRNLIGVIAPMMVVAISVMLMLGTVIGKGDLLNNLTAISPTVLTAVGIADAIHIVASWSVQRFRFVTKREVLVEVIRRNALPVFLTSVTTAVGFYSLMVSEIGPMGMLGYTAGLGTLAAYVVSMTLLPALLSIVPLPKLRADELKSDAPGPLSLSVADWVLKKRAVILGLSAITIAVTIVGISRLKIDTDFRAMFPDDNPVMTDFNWIETRLGGVGDLELVFDGIDTDRDLREFDDERARRDELTIQKLGAVSAPEEFAPLSDGETAELARLDAEWKHIEDTRIGVSGEFLAELERFESRLIEEMADPKSPMRVITDLTSPLDILRKINQVQNENRATEYRVPNQDDVAEGLREPRLEFDEWSEEWSLHPPQNAGSLIAQYFLQYENGARPGENLSTQISSDRRFFRVQGRVKQAPTVLQQDAFNRLEQIARDEFPLLVGASVDGQPALSEMGISGKTVLFSRTPKLFTYGFIESIGLALGIITILIALIFRSLALAVVSIIPNLLPILIPLSFIGLSGNPLDGPAIMVASVALGVCVDDTIHFFAKFTKARRMGKSLQDSMVFTYDQVGRAMTTTTVVLIVGFLGLTFSDFRPNYMMGTLATVMFLLAWVADILVVPALLSYFPEFNSEREVASVPAQQISGQAVSV